MELNLKAIIEAETGQNFKKNKIKCPFHKEKTSSFSVNEKKGIWKCFGCGRGGDAIQFIRDYKGFSYLDACKHLNIEPNEKYKKIASEEERIKGFINWQMSKNILPADYKLIKLYRFEDIQDNTLYYKAKFSTSNKKELRYYSFDGQSIKMKRNSEEVPYNYYRLYTALNNGKSVFIVEGEKDADTLNYIGFTATSLKGIKYLETGIFQDSKVYFIGDTGKAGDEYKNFIFNALKDSVASFNLIELSGIEELGDNSDVTDWFQAGHSKEEFIKAVKDPWDIKKNKLFKYIDSKDRPLKIWQNLNCLLKVKNIEVRYNELSKEIEYLGEGIASEIGSNALLEDIYSLCHKNYFMISKDNLSGALNRIARGNSYNPIKIYLENCLSNFDGNMDYIDRLCDTIITPHGYPEKNKKLFITKWLLNVAHIPFNDGTYGCEGMLVLQGAQGVGKTRWIKSIIPNSHWVKTGLEIDPSDKDKVYQATKYWVTELGELDATLKRDQAKLKAFFTESMDEYRRPYERLTEKYPRLTCFYATVNKEEFLKDETGNRRYWTIPAEEVIVEHDINIDQLWGEVMYLLRVEKLPYWLTEEDKEILAKNNEAFEVKDETYIKIADGFDWSYPGDYGRYTPSEICSILEIRNYTALKTTLLKFGIKMRKSMNVRYYELPPIVGESMERFKQRVKIKNQQLKLLK